MMCTVTRMEAGRAGRADGELRCAFPYCALSPDWLATFSCAFGGRGGKLVSGVLTVQFQGPEFDPKGKGLACLLCPHTGEAETGRPLGLLASQPSLIGETQTPEREGRGGGRRTQTLSRKAR